jgi:hypothetical protein
MKETASNAEDMKRQINSVHRSVANLAVRSLERGILLKAPSSSSSTSPSSNSLPPDDSNIFAGLGLSEGDPKLQLLWETLLSPSTEDDQNNNLGTINIALNSSASLAKSSCSQSLYRLVKNGHLDWLKSTDKLLDSLPLLSPSSLKNVVELLTRLLALLSTRLMKAHQKGQKLVNPFGLKVPRPHPLITLVEKRPDAWSLLFVYLDYALCLEEEIGPSAKLDEELVKRVEFCFQQLKPFVTYTLLVSSFQRTSSKSSLLP